MLTNRTAPTTSFIGREAELERCVELVESGRRVVLITGPALVGKSALAWTLAARFAGRCCFVEMGAPDAESVRRSIGAVLGLCEDELLSEALSRCGVSLLVMDGVAPESGGVPIVVGELCGDWGGTVVVTSLGPLGFRGEAQVRLAPLETSRSDSAAGAFLRSALRDRCPALSEAVEPSLLESLSRRAGGLPGALDCLADSLHLLDPGALLELLRSSGSEMLALPGAGERLRPSVERAWHGLGESGRLGLSSCAVFRAPFDLSAARAVLGEGAVAVLHDLLRRSAVTVSAESPRRYAVSPVLADLALTRGEPSPAVRAAHARYYAGAAIEWMEAANDGSSGAYGELARHAPDLEAALKFVASADFEAGAAERAELRVRLAVPLLMDAQRSSPVDSLPGWFDTIAAAAASTEGVDPAVRSRVLLVRAFFSGRRGGPAAALELLGVAYDLAVEVGADRLAGVAAFNEAVHIWSLGERDRARERCVVARGHFDRIGNRRARGRTDEFAGMMLAEAGDLEAARGAYLRAVETFRGTGADANVGIALVHLGDVHMALGQWYRGRDEMVEALAANRAAGSVLMSGMSHIGLARAAAWFGNTARAERHLEQALCVLDTDVRGRALALELCGEAALWVSDPRTAERRLEQAVELHAEVDNNAALGRAHGSYGLALWWRGQHVAAERELAESLRMATAARLPLRQAIAAARLAAFRETRGGQPCPELWAQAREAIEATSGPALPRVIEAWMITGLLATGDKDRARRRLPELIRSTDGAPAPVERFSDIRIAIALAHLDDAALARSAASLPSSSGAGLVVGESGEWFVSPSGRFVDLSSRRQLGVLLAGLVARRRESPTRPLTSQDICDLLWPGEIIIPTAAINRVHKTLSVLRKLGLASALVSTSEGYFIDEALPVSLVPEATRLQLPALALGSSGDREQR